MGGVDITAAIKGIEVDQNLPLKYYFRTARNVLREADVYGSEGNNLQQYVFLMRFASLVLETVPHHRESRLASYAAENEAMRKRAMRALSELEKLKTTPQVLAALKGEAEIWEEHFLEEGVVPFYLPASDTPSVGISWTMSEPAPASNGGGGVMDAAAAGLDGNSIEEWSRSLFAPPSTTSAPPQQSLAPAVFTGQNTTAYSSSPFSSPQDLLSFSSLHTHPLPFTSVSQPSTSSYSSSSSAYSVAPLYSSLPTLSSLRTPNSETLSRHSFMPNLLSSSSSHPPRVTSHTLPHSVQDLRVEYPSFIDASPIPDLLADWSKPATSSTPSEASLPHPPTPVDPSSSSSPLQLPPTAPPSLPSHKPSSTSPAPPSHTSSHTSSSSSSTSSSSSSPSSELITIAASTQFAPEARLVPQPTPGPVAAPVQLVPRPSAAASPLPPSAVADPRPSSAKQSTPKGPKAMHISVAMMEDFMRIVRSNTLRNLETCGVLTGILKKGTFYVTTLILPKQQSTSDSCSTLNEEELFEVQDSRGLMQLGWIHTHPSQSCFMSSIDLHTHYSYQVMLQEAIAIVMAPSEQSRKYGIFRLSEPGGMKVIQHCHQRGFHAHEAPKGGGSLYQHSPHVYFNPKIKFEIIDLR